MELVQEPEGGLTQCMTGAVRSNEGVKARYELISPIGLRRVAETYGEGAAKYGDKNWEMGFPISDILRHALQHIYNYLGGDRNEDHLAHAAWNLLAAMHSEELWPHLNGDLRGPGCTLTAKQRAEIKARNDARVVAAAPMTAEVVPCYPDRKGQLRPFDSRGKPNPSKDYLDGDGTF